MRINRRTFVAGALGTFAAQHAGMARAQSGPLRIGCITTLTGAASLLGKPQHLGMELAIRKINAAGGILGRQVELVARDDESKPATAVAAVRELAGDGVKIIAGVLSSPVALAISGIAEELGVVFLNAGAQGNNLTHENFYRNYFRVTDYAAMRVSTGARTMAEKYPTAKRWGAILPDAEVGRSTIAVFQNALPKYKKEFGQEEAEFVDPVWVKFGTTDFRNAISTLRSQEVDGIVVGVGNADEVSFLQQAGQLGLSKTLQAYVTSGTEFQGAKALGRRTPENYWSGFSWYFGAYEDNALSRELVEAHLKETGNNWPDGLLGMGHTAVLAVAAAAQKSGDLSTEALITALEGLTFDTVKGKITLRKEDHQAITECNYVKLGPDDSEQGWKVEDFVRLDGAALAGPPTPGEAIKFQ